VIFVELVFLVVSPLEETLSIAQSSRLGVLVQALLATIVVKVVVLV
jgi:hypothetical protein